MNGTADPRCHDVCPDCGKVCYASHEQARIAAARQGKRRKAQAYRCGRFWHLTTKVRRRNAST